MTEDNMRSLAADAELLAAYLENLTHQFERMRDAVGEVTKRVNEMGETIERMNNELGELRVQLMKGTDE